ncbi:uncharacterized protein involved in exopolysaccharide biosynthesis [Pseudochelatococcus lubricantis]|uniref:Uncharacterized protein involved in exopolysaccharide biosynthesis n=1 Tax=Pseudochelatococcus lubricantis TaxID=1538102 RepID=A0ABX0UVI0_9HYPH|nr:uncharacterized protein involved in exopolysaccharide biosynthesis [Pseudochelatococcus lubricantis]
MVIATHRDAHGPDNAAGGIRVSVPARHFTVRDLLAAAAYHRRVIVLAALVPVVAAIALAVFSRIQYTSNGLLMVLVSREYSGTQGVTDNGPAVLSVEGLKSVEAEVLILESAEVIRATLADIGSQALFPPSLASRWSVALGRDAGSNEDAALQAFRERLRASVQSGSNVILVGFTHPDRDLAVMAMDRLIHHYLARRKTLFDNPTSAILTSQVEHLETRLRETDGAISEEMTQAGIIDLAQDLTLAANQADSILDRRRQASERRRAIDGQLAQAEKQRAALHDTVFDSRQRSNEAVPGSNAGDLLVQLRTERESLIRRYAPGHPLIREVDAKIAVAIDSAKHPPERSTWSERDVRNPSADFIDNMVVSLNVERDALDRQMHELDAQQEQAQRRVDSLRNAETRLRVLQRERTVLTDTHGEYVKRAEAARIEETAAAVRASNVRVIQSGRDDVVARHLALPFIAAGLLAGLLSGAAAGVCAAELRPGFIRQQDAERALRLPALAVLADAPGGFDAPQNRQALLSLVARLRDIDVGGEPLSTLQLVDIGAAGDNVRLTEALAVELGAGRGLRTLAIGVSVPVTQEIESYDGVRIAETAIPGLDVASVDADSPLVSLSAPPRSARDVLAGLRHRYDVILIGFPAPSIHLTRRLAVAVEASLLVVRAEQSRGPVATWSRDNIFDAGGGIAGFVFTGRKFYLPEWIYRWL